MEINKLESINDSIIEHVIQTLEKTLNNQDLTAKQFNIFNAQEQLSRVAELLRKETVLSHNFEIDQTVKITAKQCYVCEKVNDKTDFFYNLILNDRAKDLDLCSICSASLKTELYRND